MSLTAAAFWVLFMQPRSIGTQFPKDRHAGERFLARRTVILSSWPNACSCLRAMARESRRRTAELQIDPYIFILQCHPIRGDLVSRELRWQFREQYLADEIQCLKIRPHR